MPFSLPFIHLARKSRRPGTLRVYLNLVATLDPVQFRHLPDGLAPNLGEPSADDLRSWIRELVTLGVLQGGPVGSDRRRTYRLVTGDPTVPGV